MRTISYDQVRAALVAGLPVVALAAVCLTAGLASIALALARRRDRLLVWLGAFATLYGLRLMWESDLVRAAFAAPTERTPAMVLTYLIPIAYVLFLRESLGRGWKSSLQIWFYAQLAFAPIGIAVWFVAGYWRPMAIANAALIIAGTGLALALLVTKTGATAAPALRYCMAIFVISVLANNFGLRLFGRDFEPLGFLVLIGGLAYTAARRAIGRDRQLAAVESELAMARRIQTSILPRGLPAFPCLRVAAAYYPMTSVAGDFYDFLVTDERHLTVLVADVSGHGVPAALVASMLKVAFAEQRLQAAAPACILHNLNQILNGILQGQFVTAACAHIDLDARSVTYAGAGHPPALLVRQAAPEIVELAENGLFLGPFRQATYQSVTVPLEPGDRLLLYTDGIIEATVADGQPFGAARLAHFAMRERARAADSFVGRLIDSVSAGEQEDDLTVVLTEV
jgi:sigma-B regulation protein RsbU (phosphoserine phosphatase)